MAKDEPAEVITIAGAEVRITHPSKVYFAAAKLTKLDLARYFVTVADGALRGVVDRPVVLKRFVDGAGAEPFYQKRAPATRPSFIRTVQLRFPSGRTADEVVVDDAAGLLWIVNLGCMELHPHPVRSADLEHPDELRIDLDPCPGVEWKDVRQVALEVRALLEEQGLVPFAKTSGSRGMHVNVRIEPRWGFDDVRRAALAVSREIERRAPALATSKWWKEERHGVFLDYNQNAKDRTTCSAYSVRPLPDARVSAPLDWSEVGECDPRDFTVRTMAQRFHERGDLQKGMDERRGSLDGLIELSLRDQASGVGDAPWPPYHGKRAGEGQRVAPSRKSAPRPSPKRSVIPLIVIARAFKKEDALAGLERWRARYPEVSATLSATDVLVDSMRGRSSTWTRIRINLKSVPEEQRPPQEALDPDDDILSQWGPPQGR